MKFLFFAINGRGLGHVNRTLNVIFEFRKLCKDPFLFSTSSKFAKSLYLGDPNSRILGSSTADRSVLFNHFIDLMDEFVPDNVVFDYASIELSALSHSYGSRNILILRKMDNASMDRLVDSRMGCFDFVILPHHRQEVARVYSNNAFYDLVAEGRACFTGPIVREPDLSALPMIRRKYSIRPGEFVVLGTCGGGGFDGMTEDFVRKFIGAARYCGRKCPGIRFILVTGPYYSGSVRSGGNVIVRKFERNLVELMCASSLVVAHAGYNSINEIIAAKVPSIIIPRPFSILFREAQVDNTWKVRDNSLGIVTDSMIPEGDLGILISRFYHDSDFYGSFKRRLDSFSEARGNVDAAKAIIRFASRKIRAHA
ncbi:hypothetical protein HYU11_05035 [Candidatus Woesearchaeota archaeon]|nr:hypothetical protein [Candidatus Woesearchaeota archaeon]